MHLSHVSSIWRWPAAAALSATAAIHMTLVPDHLREAPYAGALFIALSAAALATAIMLSATDHELVWLAAGAISVGALVAMPLALRRAAIAVGRHRRLGQPARSGGSRM